MKRKILTLTMTIVSICPVPSYSAEISFKCDTSKHHIVIEKAGAAQYTYRAWNKPKDSANKPDLEINNGFADLVGGSLCRGPTYFFDKGNVEIMVGDMAGDSEACYNEETPPKNAYGYVTVSINKEIKSQYWCIR
ncbi:hypothetical protein [Paraburkholderia youngii]|uniref:Uncharacterized protein n=1 Tax=Paraburkholderia youngii TaxID=2782701 RepID=A0ABX2NPF2_9BURK|nr:hypothetical protein [Paraburkholderia youngii]NVI06339.1 hypothetical protein [Paraburkholderia youngii]